ncbi:MAG: ATP-binding protein [Bacteroidales bacterium]|nr:ATP-binding protein [Bacteroidales bacterium]
MRAYTEKTIIPRELSKVMLDLAKKYPIVTLTGPRQSGKTTLARTLFPDKFYVNFERPDIREYFLDDPIGFLAPYSAGAIFDEIQRVPSLASYLQVMVDEKKQNNRFILTGSAQFEVFNLIQQSLAGRTAILRLLPFSISELESCGQSQNLNKQLFTGFYPRIYDHELNPNQMYADYVQTYIERDVRNFSEIKNLDTFQRFLRLCAGRVGQLLNLDALGADTGISGVQARAWLNILEASYIVFRLPPWFSNIGKRLIKTPKLYFYDVGLASWLLGIEEAEQLESHPLRGNIFENLIISEALKYRFNRGKNAGLYFFRDAKGMEVDLLYPKGHQFFPIEIKAGQTVASDFFIHIEKVQNLLPEVFLDGMLIYSGNEEYIRRNTQVLHYANLTHALDTRFA